MLPMSECPPQSTESSLAVDAKQKPGVEGAASLPERKVYSLIIITRHLDPLLNLAEECDGFLQK